MGSGYDMLGDLGVSVPFTGGGHHAPSAEAKIVKPIARPPRANSSRPPEKKTAVVVVPSGPPRTPTGKDSGSVSRWREMALSPTHPRDINKARHETVITEPPGPPPVWDKTVYIRGPRGRMQEYEVYDSAVPCNNICNLELSRKKAEENALKQEASTRITELAITHDRMSLQREKDFVNAKKAKQRNEIVAWNEDKKARDQEKMLQEMQNEERARAVQDRNYDGAVQDKLQEMEKKQHGKAQWRADLQKVIQDKRDRMLQEEARSRMKPHIDGFEIGGYEVPKEVVRQRGELMRKAWEEQEMYKQEETNRERQREMRHAAYIANEAEQEKARIFGEKVMARERNVQARNAQQDVMHQKADNDFVERSKTMEADKQRAERDRLQSIAAKESEDAFSKYKKDKFRQVLSEQMTLKQAAEAAKAAKECGPHMTHNGVGMRDERKILFRCPITNQLLPPSAFNLKTRPSRPRIIVP